MDKDFENYLDEFYPLNKITDEILNKMFQIEKRREKMEQQKEKRVINNRLTKDMLLNWGIEIFENKDSEYGWDIFQTRNGKTHQVAISRCITPHKYTENKIYLIVSFAIDNKKVKTYSLGKLLHAYFKGDVPNSYQVDHIDNDQFNNKLENLQILTQADNLRKRFLDLDTICFNQFYNKNRKGEN